jgi:drug/metabolite transporter (DMT)-like permease
MDPAERRERAWTEGIGLLVLGLVVSGVASGVALQGDPGALLAAAGWTGYAAGVAVAGAGVHRILWARGSARGRPARLAITALVTVPVFALAALLLSVLLTVLQLRFAS